jgi:hypothetical protein
VLLLVLVPAEPHSATTITRAWDRVGKREYLMPGKKGKEDASTAKTKVPDMFESWLAKQPVKSSRAKAGYVSAKENRESQ